MTSDVHDEHDDEGADAPRDPRRRRPGSHAPVEAATPTRLGDVGGDRAAPRDRTAPRADVSAEAVPSRARERPGRRGGGFGRRSARPAAEEPVELPAHARITALEEHGRKAGRYTVRLEGVPSTTVSAEIVERLSLGVGRVLERAQLERLRDAAAALRTYDRALNLLAFRARSSADLRRRLVQKGESPAFADQAIERLTSLGLLDDAAYARQVTRSKVLGAGASKRRLQQELFRKGVARPVADEAIAEVLEDESIDEDATVEKLARRKLRSLEKLDPASRRRRLYGFLARRGFDSQVIRRAMSKVLGADDAEALDGVEDDDGTVE